MKPKADEAKPKAEPKADEAKPKAEPKAEQPKPAKPKVISGWPGRES